MVNFSVGKNIKFLLKIYPNKPINKKIPIISNVGILYAFLVHLAVKMIVKQTNKCNKLALFCIINNNDKKNIDNAPSNLFLCTRYDAIIANIIISIAINKKIIFL